MLDQYEDQGLFGVQLQSLLQPLSSTLCGPKYSRNWTNVRRPAVPVIVPAVAAKSVSSITPMPTVWTRQVLGYFTLRLPLRTSLSWVPTSPVLLRKLLHQSNVFISVTIKLSWIGGLSISSDLLYHPGLSYPSSWQCRVTLNRHNFEKNMQTGYFVTLVLNLPSMKPVYIYTQVS
jgi:hypothetical protein